MTRVKIKYIFAYDDFIQEKTDNWLEENKNFHVVDVKVSGMGSNTSKLASVITYYESTKRDLMIEKA